MLFQNRDNGYIEHDQASCPRSGSPGGGKARQHTSSDRTPLARMLPRVIGGPGWDRGLSMPGE
jgi:hypothetical protein